MFGSDILEIALGLVLVYLLLSLLMTAVQEGLEHMMRTRARDLRAALLELVQGDESLLKEIYKHPLIFALHKARNDEDLSEKSKALPSYIPREAFSAALIDLIEAKKAAVAGGTGTEGAATEAADAAGGGEVPPPAPAPLDDLISAYEGLKRITRDEVPALRREVEKWYDGAMDRASGWFKRRAQRNLFLLGFGASLLLNINSVTIARHLAIDPQARNYADQLAQRVAREGLPEAREATGAPLEQAKGSWTAAAAYREQIKEVGLPIGWDETGVDRIVRAFPPRPAEAGIGYYVGWTLAALVLLLGYLVTALAVMLGAPFWFDVLNKIMVIRGTVKPKEKSPDEPPVDGAKADRSTAAATEPAA
jgi:hypothetical protein